MEGFHVQSYHVRVKRAYIGIYIYVYDVMGCHDPLPTSKPTVISPVVKGLNVRGCYGNEPKIVRGVKTI